MQGEDDFVEGLGGGEQLLDREASQWPRSGFGHRDRASEMLRRHAAPHHQGAGEHLQERLERIFSRHDISLFFFLEAATAGPRCVPIRQGAQARAARRRGRALKAAQPSSNGPAALCWGPRSYGVEERSCARDALCQGCSNSRPAYGRRFRREGRSEKHHPAQRAGPHVRPVRNRATGLGAGVKIV